MEHFDLGSIEQWILITLAIIAQTVAFAKWVIAGNNNIYKYVDDIRKERDRQIELVKDKAELRYAESARRDAELSERITISKADYMQGLAQYVTRPELDRRLEQIENSLVITGNKLDAILHRLAGVKMT